MFYMFTKTGGRNVNLLARVTEWSLPSGDSPGDWMPSRVISRKGRADEPWLYPLYTEDLLLGKINDELWVAEGMGESKVDKYGHRLFPEARLVRRVVTWNDRTARHFACDCVERVLHYVDDVHLRDYGIYSAVHAARLFADGRSSTKVLQEWWTHVLGLTCAPWAGGTVVTAVRMLFFNKAAWAAREAAVEASRHVGIKDGKFAEKVEHEWQHQFLMEYLSGRAIGEKNVSQIDKGEGVME